MNTSISHIAFQFSDHTAMALPLVILSVALLIAMVVVSSVILKRNPTSKRGPLMTGIFGAAAAASIFAAVGVSYASSVGDAEALHDRRAAYSDAIEARYGLDLNGDETRELDFPIGKPTGEKPFGTITLRDVTGGHLTTSDVTLIWDGTGYALVSNGDDGSWTELPTR